MIKQKLINKRKEKGMSQSEMADLLNMEQSQYSRRESGTTRISKKEWDKIVKILDVPLDEIYEPQDGVYIVNNENPTFNDESTNNFYTVPDFAIETMKKYIEKLENENAALKEEIEKLRSQ